jgi:uncharacterized membrane protein
MLTSSVRSLGQSIRRALVVDVSWQTLVVLLLTLGYGFLMLWACWMKYYTFNATYLDLGLNNHIYWLLSHGGVAGYYASGYASVYPVQYEEAMYFALTPFYALFPGVGFLLTVQSFGVAFSAVPLYFLARRRLKAAWTSVLIVLVYLSSFTLTSALLFDYHNESLFPLFFLLTVLAWDRGQKAAYAVLAVLCSIIDPLALLLVLFFTFSTFAPGGRAPLFQRLRQAVTNLTKPVIETGVAALLVWLLVVYRLSGTLFPTFVGSSTPGMAPLEVILYSVNLKVEMLVVLYASLAFIPLLAPRAAFILLPYFGFVFYTVAPSHWTDFGVQYPILAAPVLFYGLILALEELGPRESAVIPASVASPEGRQDRAAVWRRRDRAFAKSHAVQAFALAGLVFAVVYFPFSPANPYVSGGYFSGNANAPGFTAVTPAVQFLHQVLALIPPLASVLTQNNIPQLSGREYFQTPATLDPKVNYTYILLDTELTYFAYVETLIPIAQGALSNGTFGILAEGEGALLLERGYSGAPVLFAQTSVTLEGSQLAAYSATVVGSTLVGGSAAPWMWFGPYTALLPGTYQVEFEVASNRTTPTNSRAITLEVSAAEGKVEFAQRPEVLGNFTAPNTPTNFELTAVIPSIAEGVEFRGTNPTGVATLTLYQVSYTMTSPPA